MSWAPGLMRFVRSKLKCSSSFLSVCEVTSKIAAAIPFKNIVYEKSPATEDEGCFRAY